MTSKLERMVGDFPTVYLSGARQCGKSTLVQKTLPSEGVNYLTFDTSVLRLAAQRDPEGFVASLPKDRLNIIDEIQRVPEVFLLLKKGVDEGRRGGRGKSLFLLTGSANIFALPELANAMVGRIAILTLHTFSAAEVARSEKNFIGELWNGKLATKSVTRANVPEVIGSATFPEIALDPGRRSAWLDNYLETILGRDAAELAKIRKPDVIRQLLVSLGGRVGSLLKDDNVMKETGMNQGTYQKYKAFCNAAFMTFEVQPWAKPNRLNKRFVKSKKIYFTDTNFLCFVLRRDLADVHERDPVFMGHLFENFVASEIMKNIAALPGKFYVSHFNPVREDGREVDFVVEDGKGDALAIEVKLSASLDAQDFKNLEACRDTLGDKFKRGIVLYTGENLAPFGDRLWAVPVNTLWE